MTLIGLHFSPSALLPIFVAKTIGVIGMVRDPTQRLLSAVMHCSAGKRKTPKPSRALDQGHAGDESLARLPCNAISAGSKPACN